MPQQKPYGLPYIIKNVSEKGGWNQIFHFAKWGL